MDEKRAVRFTFESHGTGNTPDEVEAAAIALARPQLGGYDGDLRVSEGYRLHRAEDPAPPGGVLSAAAQSVNEQALTRGHTLYALLYVEALTKLPGDGEDGTDSTPENQDTGGKQA